MCFRADEIAPPWLATKPKNRIIFKAFALFWAEAFLHMDFSLFKTITQRVSVLNNNPPAMRVETICYTKKSPIRYNIVVQATIVRKDGDFNG